MGSMTFTTMQTELQRRILQLGATDAGAAINRAIRWVNRQGAYTFQSSGLTSTPTSTLVGTYANFATGFTLVDPGKPIVFLNPNNTPIRRASMVDPWESQNFNTISGSGYNTYSMYTDNVGNTSFYFYPQITSGAPTVQFLYHKLTVDISGSTTSNLPRDFDDLIIDLAEAEESRIFDKGEVWAGLLQRSQQETMKLLDGYHSVTISTGLSSENSMSVQEKAQVGRG